MKPREPAFEEKQSLSKHFRDEIKIPLTILYKKPQKPRFVTKKPVQKQTPKLLKIVIPNDELQKLGTVFYGPGGKRIRGVDGRFIKPDRIKKGRILNKVVANTIVAGSRIGSTESSSSVSARAEELIDPTDLGTHAAPISQVLVIPPAKKKRRKPRKKGDPRRFYLSTTNEDASTNQLEGRSSEFDSIAAGSLSDPLGKRKKPSQCELPEELLAGPENRKRMLLANQADLEELRRIKQLGNPIADLRRDRQHRRRKFEDSKDDEKLMQIRMVYNHETELWQIASP